MKTRITSIIIILCILFTSIPTMAVANTKAYQVQLTEENKITIRLGETYQLKYAFYPVGSTADIWFSSSNGSVANVDERTGLITALKPGETKIETGLFLLSGNRANTQSSRTVKVIADNIATDFEIPDKLTLVRKEKSQLSVKLLPEGMTVPQEPIRFSSTDINKLQIDNTSGLITPNNPGTATVVVRMGQIEKKCEVTIVPEEGYVEPTVYWKGEIKEGWYIIRCMYNFLNVASDGSLELRWKNPASTFYIKEDDKGTTIKTADGKYLALSGSGQNGDKVITQATPYYWLSMGSEFISLWIYNKDYPYMMVNANNESNSDGTKLIVWDNKNWNNPYHGNFQLIPANGKNPQYIKSQVVSPFEETKPFTLLPSSVKGNDTTIFGLTMGKTTVGEMKALYGEPDDVWYEESEIDNNTAWYFYRNNWTDMILVGAEQPYDEELFWETGAFQSDIPIEGDDCIIGGIYTNKIDLNLGSSTKLPKDMYLEYMKDNKGGNKTFATFIGTSDFYFSNCKYYFPDDGSGNEIGPMQKGVYYTLNAYLATKGWNMLQLDELASFNLFKEARAKRDRGKVAMLGYDTGKTSELASAEGEYWQYMIMVTIEADKFRGEMWSGKYNTIAIGSSMGWDTDIDSWEEEDRIKEGTWGTLIAKLGYNGSIVKKGNNSGNNTQNNSDTPTQIGITGVKAEPTNSTVYVNGKPVAFDAYRIDNSNFFKLRDLAYVLKGTEKQFEVGWDGATNSISLTSGKSYTAAGGEMASGGKGIKSAASTNSKIMLNGSVAKLTAYNIDGNNYFKLRDIGITFNFGVDWDGVNNAIIINTKKAYGAQDQITEVNKSEDLNKPPKGLANISQEEWDVLRFTNIERAKNNLPMFVTFDVVQKGAQVRADELIVKYDHIRPNGSNPNTAFDEVKYSYNAFAENIASGQSSAEEVVQGWMNSPGHRANILNESLHHMAVGYNSGSWVQLFSTDSGSVATVLEYNKELGYFTLKLKSGVTAYAPYDPISSPTVGGKVTFNYPIVDPKSSEESGLKIVSYPKKLEYKVGEGFDTTGASVTWIKYQGGEDKDFTDKVEFYTSKTVKLTQGRPFTTSGKKVVEIRNLGGKVLGTYTINVTK